MSVAAPPTVVDNPPRRRQRWVLVSACALGFVAIPVLAYAYLAWAADRDIDAALPEIDRDDPRWRLDEILADRKPIADAENPALVVGKVGALLQPRTYDVGEKNWRLFENLPSVPQLNVPQIAALREALTKHDEAVKLARTLKDFGGEGRLP